MEEAGCTLSLCPITLQKKLSVFPLALSEGDFDPVEVASISPAEGPEKLLILRGAGEKFTRPSPSWTVE